MGIILVVIVVALRRDGIIVTQEELECVCTGGQLKAEGNIWVRVVGAVLGDGLVIVENKGHALLDLVPAGEGHGDMIMQSYSPVFTGFIEVPIHRVYVCMARRHLQRNLVRDLPGDDELVEIHHSVGGVHEVVLLTTIVGNISKISNADGILVLRLANDGILRIAFPGHVGLGDGYADHEVVDGYVRESQANVRGGEEAPEIIVAILNGTEPVQDVHFEGALDGNHYRLVIYDPVAVEGILNGFGFGLGLSGFGGSGAILCEDRWAKGGDETNDECTPP